MTILNQERVSVLSKYAVFSNHPDDILFNKQNFKNPIFCAGHIRNIGNNVYNLKIGDLVGFFSPNHTREQNISSNLIVKISREMDYSLITIIHYASLVMNILRVVNPKIGQKILIIGVNFFVTFLKKLFDLSGTKV